MMSSSMLPHQPAAARTASKNQGCRLLLIIFGILCACSCAVISFGIDMLDVGPPQWMVGMVIAILPVPIYIALALWIDRFEPEPGWMLAVTFFWGAIAASLIATLFNTIGDLLVSAAAGKTAGTLFAYILSAPVVEESAKGLAVLILFFWKKDEFDDVTDGIVYAAMVGLGFAMSENALYYGRQYAAGGLQASMSLFLSRGLLAPYLHPIFTAMTGAGLGWAAQSTRKWVKWIAPLGGLFLAMTLHGLWNTMAIFGAASEALGVFKYVCLETPALLLVLVFVFFSQRNEGRVIREYLREDVQNGILSQAEYETIHSLSARSRESWSAFFKGGFKGWARRSSFQQAASELAFLRWRVARGVNPNPALTAQKEAACLQAISDLRR